MCVSFIVANVIVDVCNHNFFLSIGPLSDANVPNVPTFTNNLFAQGIISANEIAISFEPTTSEVANNGELTFGGTDSSKFIGTITFAPLSQYHDLRLNVNAFVFH